jgi:RNA polymerase sigma-70 factor (ECF subfamily)
MTEKEKNLLAACLKRDKAAWDTFVLQYSGLVYHTIKGTLTLHHTEPRSDLVEDLYQEFFFAILRDDCKKLRQFKGNCSVATWLKVITARLTIDFLRKLTPPSLEVTDSIPGDAPNPIDSLISGEQESLLNEALESLTPRERILIDLFFVKGLAAEEVAAILKTSVEAIYTQKNRALDKLRKILAKTSLK